MDGLRKEQFLGTDKYILGDSGTDLVLETLGKVYVKIGNQTKVLSDVLELLDATADTTTTNDITLVNGTIELEGLTYPGDGKFIFDTLSSTLYISYNKGYIAIAQGTSGSGEYVKKSGDTMTGQLEITTNKAPLIVASRELVDNLNVQYLDGYSSDELAKKAIDEIIKGKWTFSSNTIFKNNVRHYGDIVTSGNIGTSEFMSGFSGYGWRLDTTTNMLTVDYLVVRKAMRVYELSVTKITATNGAIWVTNSSKCKEAKQPIILTQNMVENAKEGIYTTNQALGKLLNSKEYYIVDVDENKEIITKTVEISNSSTINTVSTQFVCFKYMAYIIDPKKLTESTYFAGLSTLYNHSLLNTQAYSDTSSKTYANDVKELNSCMMIFPLYQEVDTFNDTLGTHTYSNTFNRDTNFFTVYDEDNFSLITNKTSDYIVGLQPYYKYFALDKTIYDAALAKTATSNVVPVPGLFVVVTSDDEYPVFKGADILRCQKFEDTSNIKYYDAIVLSHIQTRTFIVQKAPSVFDKYTKISYNKDGSVASYEESYNEDQYNKTLKSYNSNTGKEEYNSSDTHTGDTTNQDSKLADIAAEDSLVQIGNIENLERQGSLYLTSSDDQSPYMDVIANLNRPDYSVLYKQPIFDTKEFVIDSLDNIKATDTSKFYKLKNKYYYQSIVPEIPYGIIYNYGKESNSIYATVNLTKIDTTRNTATVTNTRSSGDLSLTRVSINNTEAGVTPTSATRDITVSLIYSIPEGHIAQYRAGETTDITTLGWNNMEDNIHLTVSTNTGIKNLAFQIRDMSVIASVNCYVTLTPTKDSVVSIKNNKHVCDYIKPVKVRVGKLDGIYDNKLGNKQPYGYGLYGENVFLTGEFYLNNGNSVIDVAQDGIKAYYKNAGITISDYLDNSGNKVPTTIDSDGMQEYQQCIEFDADKFIFKLPTGKKMTFSSMFGSDNKFDHALLDVQGIIQAEGLIIKDYKEKDLIILVGDNGYSDGTTAYGAGAIIANNAYLNNAYVSGTVETKVGKISNFSIYNSCLSQYLFKRGTESQDIGELTTSDAYYKTGLGGGKDGWYDLEGNLVARLINNSNIIKELALDDYGNPTRYDVSIESIYPNVNKYLSSNDYITYMSLGKILLSNSNRYATTTLDNVTIGLGRGCDPDEANFLASPDYASSALYIYRQSTMGSMEYAYWPAVRIISNNTINRNVALFAKGAITSNSIIQTGCIIDESYTNNTDKNIYNHYLFDLSYGTKIGVKMNSNKSGDIFSIVLPVLHGKSYTVGTKSVYTPGVAEILYGKDCTPEPFIIELSFVGLMGTSEIRLQSPDGVLMYNQEGTKYGDTSDTSYITFGAFDNIKVSLIYTGTLYYIQFEQVIYN